MGERHRRIEPPASLGEQGPNTARGDPNERHRPATSPSRNSGTSVATATDADAVEDTQPGLVVPILHEPLADDPLPPNVTAWLETGSCSLLITKVRAVIGRGPGSDARLHDPKASRKHASIFFTGSEFRVRDESSANGTLLNGSRVVEYAIRDGDELLIGDAVLRFRCRFG